MEEREGEIKERMEEGVREEERKGRGREGKRGREKEEGEVKERGSEGGREKKRILRGEPQGQLPLV